jgi:hypothetical protein
VCKDQIATGQSLPAGLPPPLPPQSKVALCGSTHPSTNLAWSICPDKWRNVSRHNTHHAQCGHGPQRLQHHALGLGGGSSILLSTASLQALLEAWGQEAVSAHCPSSSVCTCKQWNQ